jgi:ubiquinone/menaquinone biosynthesis C-methylase UbiE
MAIFITKVKRNYSYFNNIFYSYFLKKYREKIFKIFLENIKLNKIYKVIDIGSTAVDSMSENYFIHNYPYKKSITCFSNQKLDNLKNKYPFLIIKKGDGRNTNFPDNFYEIVHSNATIEHVGSFDNQIKFVRELYRISKKIIFMQTPNRYFPIDFHTLLPFLHWLPKKMHRKILDIIGLKFLSKESNLNLLSIKELKEICRILKINSYTIKKVKIFGLVSNLILIIRKPN